MRVSNFEEIRQTFLTKAQEILMQNLGPFLSAPLFVRRPLAGGSSFIKHMQAYLRLAVFLALGLATIQRSQAQDVSTYKLAATAGTFIPITGGTTIAILAQDDAISPYLALPFTFYYGGTGYTALQATSRGYLAFTGNNFAYSQNTFGFASTRIAPLWDELSGIGGMASYVVTGTAPNRVFTFQWLNWRWPVSATAANISYQAKLYEGSNVIQFIYRPEAGNFNSTTASATIGLDGGTYSAGDNYSYKNFACLSDASANAVLASNLNPSGMSVDNINTRPGAGQTYTFTPTNDYCVHATPLAYGSVVTGSTLEASTPSDPRTTCTTGGTLTPSNSVGVFYSLVGNGQTVTVSTCAGPTATGGNTKLFVYSGNCGNFTCVGANDDVLSGGCGTNPQASAVTFPTQSGTVYTVYVQFAQQGATGAFGLSVSGTALATKAALGAGTLELYPNPASGAFTLQLPALGSERNAEFTLLNSLGQLVQTRAISLTPTGTQAQIEVKTLPPGLYTVRVQAGQQTTTRQLVIE